MARISQSAYARVMAELTGPRRTHDNDDGTWHLLTYSALGILSAEASLRNARRATRERSRVLVEQAKALPQNIVGRETYQAIAVLTAADALRAPDLDIEATLAQAERTLLANLPNGGTQ